MESRTFRQSSCFALVGGVIALVGAMITSIAAYHLATGIPLVEANSKLHPGQHVAGSGELWFAVAGGLPFVILGVLLTLNVLNSAIVIDGRGMVATNLLKRRTFDATWTEITAVNRVGSGAGAYYEVIANGETLRIQNSTAHMRKLAAEIQKRSGHSATTN